MIFKKNVVLIIKKTMNRIYIFLIFLFFEVLTYKVQAQAFIGALSFGGNLSQVDGDQVYGYKKLGLNIGVAAFYPIIKDKFFTSIEISYSQKGAFQKYPIVEDPTKKLPYYNLKLNYLDIPFMVHYLDKRVVMVGAGISFGRLIGLQETEWGIKKNSQVVGGPYNRDDWDLIIDLRLPIYHRFKFNFRYNYSITKIRTRTFTNDAGEVWSRKQYNNYLTFKVIYMFNEKIRPKESKQ
jgi:hypothetical protein